MKKIKQMLLAVLGLLICNNYLQAEKSKYELARNIEVTFREDHGGNYYSTIIFNDSLSNIISIVDILGTILF